MNVPNKITLSRIIMIPIIMFIYLADFIPYGKFIATFLFLVASFTDLLDGYIARKYNLVTDTGKFLDPIADKMLVMAGLLILFADGVLSTIILIVFASVIFARDYAINSLRQVASAKGTVIAAAKSGKLKTVALDIALVLAMFVGGNLQSGLFGGLVADIFIYATYAFIGISTFLVLYSMIDYFIANKQVFKEN